MSLTPEQKAAVALGKINQAKERLMAKYPLHAGIINKMPVVSQPNVETMAVTIRGEQVYLLYAPKFVRSIPIKELVGVLLHEIHHVIFNHLLMTRKDYPHENARIIAQEVTVNEFVMEPLPEGCILLKNYPDLPPLESTKQRYERLLKTLPPQITISIKTLDNHSVWGSDGSGSGEIGEVSVVGGSGTPEEKREKAEQILKDLVEGAIKDTPPGSVPQELMDMIENHGIGTEPGEDFETVLKGVGKVDWKVLLRRYCGQVLQVRSTYTRPPRRFPEMLGILPAQSRLGSKPKVMGVIDTSGSISSVMLSMIDGELCRLHKQGFEVLVVECDTKIYRTYPYRPLTDVYGRGGTDLRPPFEPKFLAKHRPDLMVFFTDLYGPTPEKPPPIPVIWAVLPYGGEAPWGRVVKLT